MTISITNSFAVKIGDGATTAFAFSQGGNGIYFAANSEVIINLRNGASVTPQTEGVHYTLTGAGSANGVATFITAPADGTYIDMFRSTALTQELSLSPGSDFSAVSVMASLDKLTRITQDLAHSYYRSLLAPWATATAYTAGQSVTNDGSTYTCIVPHTSGSTTEPGAGASWEAYWVVAAASGVDGAIPVVSTVSRSIDTGDHVVMANAAAATLTVTSGALWFYVSRSSDSAADVTVDPPAGYTIEGNADGVIINAVVGPVGFIVNPALSTDYITFSPSVSAPDVNQNLISKTVAELGVITPTAGVQYFASNGRKNGEGSGSGTGVLVFGDGSNWIASDTGATVAA